MSAILRRGESELDNVIRQLDQQLAQVELQGQKTVSDIDADCDRLEKALRERRRRLKNEALCGIAKAKIQAVKDTFVERKAGLTTHRASVDRIKRAMPSKFLNDINPTLQSKMKNLDLSVQLPAGMKAVSIPPMTTDREALKQVEREVKNLGLVPAAVSTQLGEWRFSSKHGKNVCLLNEGHTVMIPQTSTSTELAPAKGTGLADCIVVASQSMSVNIVYEVMVDAVGNRMLGLTCGALLTPVGDVTLPVKAHRGWDRAVVFSNTVIDSGSILLPPKIQKFWGPVMLVFLMVVVTQRACANLFTSSDKLQSLPDREEALLTSLEAYLKSRSDNDTFLTRFFSERSRALAGLRERGKGAAWHPNAAFHHIRAFAANWARVLSTYPDLNVSVGDLTSALPSQEDYAGACSALVRLQLVYGLHVHDVYAGNYSGFLGPPLQPWGAADIGLQAFAEGHLNVSIDWLELSLLKYQAAATGISAESKAHILATLARAYRKINRVDRAQDLYTESKKLAPEAAVVVQLGKELATNRTFTTTAASLLTTQYRELCQRHVSQRVTEIRPFHVCLLKRGSAVPPYVTFKVELLSLVPFASLIYDVIYDDEIRVLTDLAKGKLDIAKTGNQEKPTVNFRQRSSQLAWVKDDQSPVVKRVSQRVKVMTGLEVEQRLPHGPSSAESFQVLNYGMAGHYNPHLDTYEKDTPPVSTHLRNAGNRIATVLFYLCDVEKGGNTVFVRAGISVAPVKGAALVWYNLEPDCNDPNPLTLHAGCPVMIGHKWIANKWILTYGNTFRRPCGSRLNTTQLQLEEIMGYSYFP